jgi:TolB-like protein/Tfp pilus assembly protein PilF
MKRCPQCNRLENDESLKFCRADGATLVSDSSSISHEAGTVQLGSTSSTEIRTSILPQTTEANINRATGPTNVLPALQSAGTTNQFAVTTKKRLSTRGIIVIGSAIVALVTAAVVISYRSGSRSATINSIAVMPFVNVNNNADVQYLSDGMTETLIRSLSQLPNLNVKARATVFRYQGQSIDPKTIGKALNVQAVLNGRVTQRGEQLSLNLELIDTQTENVIWADQYDRKSSDLVSLQNEIARDVSNKLQLKLSGVDQQKLSKTYTNDPEAYRLYLQARFYLNKRVGKEYEKAERFLQQSIERDPNFALGYVGLAEFISQRDRPKAKEYIARALAIDNQLSEAHGNLGLQLTLDHDWVAAERELNRAIELDPNNSRAHKWKGELELKIGRYDECVRSHDRAIALDPISADIRTGRGACFVAAGRIEEGIAAIKEAMRVEPEYAWAYSHISFVYRLQGNHAASVEARAHSIELLDRPDLAKRLRDAFANGGWTSYLRELLAQTDGNFPSLARRASILAELGQKEEALATLEQGATKGEWWLFSIKYDPAFDPLRGDPRFQALLKKFEAPH